MGALSNIPTGSPWPMPQTEAAAKAAQESLKKVGVKLLKGVSVATLASDGMSQTIVGWLMNVKNSLDPNWKYKVNTGAVDISNILKVDGNLLEYGVLPVKLYNPEIATWVKNNSISRDILISELFRLNLEYHRITQKQIVFGAPAEYHKLYGTNSEIAKRSKTPDGGELDIFAGQR